MYTALSQTGKLLKEFKKRKRLTNHEIVRNLNIFRYSARIAELRKEGNIIRCDRVEKGLFSYTYEGLTPERQLEEGLEEVKIKPQTFNDRLIERARRWL